MVLVLGPVISCVTSVLFQKERATFISSAFFVLTGLAGAAAGIYGLLSEEPYVVSTNLFFGMTATFDKFSAMFLLPMSIVIFAISLMWYSKRKTSQLIERTFALSVAIIGATWTLFAGNIIGLAAALLLMVGGATFFMAISTTEITAGAIGRLFITKYVGAISIISGLFILSSGALFNDFSTLSYIAAEIDTMRLAVAFGLFTFGTVLFMDLWPFHRFTSLSLPVLEDAGSRVFVQMMFFTISMYVVLRQVLFILPPLSSWFSIPLGFIGILTMIVITRKKNPIVGFIFGAGTTVFMMSVAILFQSVGAYEAMNIALFATLLNVAGVVIIETVREIFPFILGIDSSGRGIRLLQVLAALGLPPSILFCSQWMIGSAIIGNLSSLSRGFAAYILIGFFVMFGSLFRRGIREVSQLRKEFASLTSVQQAEQIPFGVMVLTAISTIGAFLVPAGLYRIGATPLAMEVDSWRAALLAGDGVVRIIVLVFGVVLASILVWVFRDKNHQSEAGVIFEEDIEASREEKESRLAIFYRGIQRAVSMRIAAPIFVGVNRVKTWQENRSIHSVPLSIVFMLFIIIITLAIAL